MKKFIITPIIIMSIANANAGLKGFTMHSRANCGNNETISWHAGHAYTLKTYSNHFPARSGQHVVIAGVHDTWRSAAVHWGEARPGSGYMVIGIHYMDMHDGKGLRELKRTTVTNCAIYDGWWD